MSTDDPDKDKNYTNINPSIISSRDNNNSNNSNRNDDSNSNNNNKPKKKKTKNPKEKEKEKKKNEPISFSGKNLLKKEPTEKKDLLKKKIKQKTIQFDIEKEDNNNDNDNNNNKDNNNDNSNKDNNNDNDNDNNNNKGKNDVKKKTVLSLSFIDANNTPSSSSSSSSNPLHQRKEKKEDDDEKHDEDDDDEHDDERDDKITPPINLNNNRKKRNTEKFKIAQREQSIYLRPLSSEQPLRRSEQPLRRRSTVMDRRRFLKSLLRLQANFRGNRVRRALGVKVTESNNNSNNSNSNTRKSLICKYRDNSNNNDDVEDIESILDERLKQFAEINQRRESNAQFARQSISSKLTKSDIIFGKHKNFISTTKKVSQEDEPLLVNKRKVRTSKTKEILGQFFEPVDDIEGTLKMKSINDRINNTNGAEYAYNIYMDLPTSWHLLVEEQQQIFIEYIFPALLDESTWSDICLLNRDVMTCESLIDDYTEINLDGEVERLILKEVDKQHFIPLEGFIPPQIQLLQDSLEVLDLSQNSLKGEIPDEIGNLHQLLQLNLNENQLIGSIPESIGDLKCLKMLYLRHNQLSGCLPKSITQLHEVAFIDLSENAFSGELDPELGRLTNLMKLILSYNNFTGTIPSTFGYLRNLKELRLNNNYLEGRIPSDIGSLKELDFLNLSNNEIEGAIPSTICQCVKLRELLLHDNELEGNIPVQLVELQELKLRTLNLTRNKFTGAIPPELLLLKNLVLGLRDNSFSNAGLYINCIPRRFAYKEVFIELLQLGHFLPLYCNIFFPDNLFANSERLFSKYDMHTIGIMLHSALYLHKVNVVKMLRDLGNSIIRNIEKKNIHDFWNRPFTSFQKQCILDTYRLEFLQVACFGRFHMDNTLIESLNHDLYLKKKVVKELKAKKNSLKRGSTGDQEEDEEDYEFENNNETAITALEFACKTSYIEGIEQILSAIQDYWYFYTGTSQYTNENSTVETVAKNAYIQRFTLHEELNVSLKGNLSKMGFNFWKTLDVRIFQINTPVYYNELKNNKMKVKFGDKYSAAYSYDKESKYKFQSLNNRIAYFDRTWSKEEDLRKDLNFKIKMSRLYFEQGAYLHNANVLFEFIVWAPVYILHYLFLDLSHRYQQYQAGKLEEKKKLVSARLEYHTQQLNSSKMKESSIAHHTKKKKVNPKTNVNKEDDHHVSLIKDRKHPESERNKKQMLITYNQKSKEKKENSILDNQNKISILQQTKQSLLFNTKKEKRIIRRNQMDEEKNSMLSEQQVIMGMIPCLGIAEIDFLYDKCWYARKEKNNQIFKSPVIQAVIILHWEYYAKAWHQRSFLKFLLFLGTFHSNVYIDYIRSNFNRDFELFAKILLWCQIINLFGLEIRQIRTSGSVYFTDNWKILIFVVLSLLTLTRILKANMLYFDDKNETQYDNQIIGRENLLLLDAFISLSLWVALLNYMRPFRGTGPLISMILKIINDIFYFIIISIIMILAFASAFFIIFLYDEDSSNLNLGPHSSYLKSWFALFKSVFGISDIEYYEDVDNPNEIPLLIVWGLFMLLVSVILMNILIAIISDSYENVLDNRISTKEYESAKIITSIHDTLPLSLQKHWMQKSVSSYVHLLLHPDQVKDMGINGFRTGEQGNAQWKGRINAVKKAIEDNLQIAKVDIASQQKEGFEQITDLIDHLKKEILSIKEHQLRYERSGITNMQGVSSFSRMTKRQKIVN